MRFEVHRGMPFASRPPNAADWNLALLWKDVGCCIKVDGWTDG